MSLTFQKASWTDEKIEECRKELNQIFFAAVGKGEKRMNPHAVDILNKDRVDIAAILINLIQQEVALTDPLPFFVNEVPGDIRNNYVWQELDSSLRVVSRSYGSKPLSQRMTFKEYSVSTTMKETGVEIPLEEVFSGRQTPALAASEMGLAISRFRITNTMDLIDAGVPSATNDRTSVSGYTLRYVDGGALSQGNLDKAIDGLQDEGEDVAVLGRHVSLFPAIRAFSNNVSFQVDEDFFRRGVVADYHGAKIVTLKDPVLRRNPTHIIRKDRIYVSSGAKGCIYMTKPVDFLNYAFVDPRTATFGTGLRIEDGLLMYDPYRYRILEVNPG